MDDVITKKRRFWMPRRFVDDYAVNLTPYTQSVYMALCRYADKDGFCFWGCRRLAEKLGMNKSTVSSSMKELVASGLTVRGIGKRNKVSGLYLRDVRFNLSELSGGAVPKKVFKEAIKQDILEPRRTNSNGMKKLRETLQEDGIWAPPSLRGQTAETKTLEVESS